MNFNDIHNQIDTLNILASVGKDECLSTEDGRLISKKVTQMGKLDESQSKTIAKIVSTTFSQLKEKIESTKNFDEKITIFKQLSNNNLLDHALSTINDLHLEIVMETPEQLLLAENIQYVKNSSLLLQTYLGNESYNFYSTYSPEMLLPLALGMEGLKLSENPLTPEAIRESMGPKPTGAGTANGSFLLYAPVDFKKDKSEAEVTLVVKPASQENGMPGNPNGHIQSLQLGIEGGKGVIRERIAYTCQTMLGLDFGIPPTEIIRSEHFVLSECHGIIVSAYKIILEFVKEPIQDPLDVPRILKEKSELGADQLVLEVLNKLYKSLSPSEITIKNFILAYKTLDKTQNPTLSFPKLLNLFKEKCEVNQNTDAILIKSFLKLYNLSSSENPPLISSAQVFMPECKTYINFDLEKISNREMHKLVIDLIIFNTDRHLNNILFRMVNNEIKVILIDHGSTLPIPSVASLKRAKFEWMVFDQFNDPLDTDYADKITALDIDDYIAKVKLDMTGHVEQFGPLCTIDESCFQLMELNLRMLKAGIRLGCSVKAMGLFHQEEQIDNKFYGGEIGQVYDQFIGSLNENESVDWKMIEAEIKAILQKDISERECDY